METLYTHACIKCKTAYTDTDPDAYLCTECNDARLAIAQEVDAKFALTSRERPQSDLQVYDEMCRARGTRFASINDLGIKL